ncbi:MAG: sporulation initiation factor Spo0A C-terminal domain-containing protein [Christensenellaceae bacterium]|nr:sporulation initiation factor Spo0A C-terminal domain-containing protein [Christensenellaceae bacterium]
MNIQKRVTDFLFDFGFPTKVNGYHYLKCGIICIHENQGVPSSKELYAHISERFNTDADNIDRCLRTLVDKMWPVLAKSGLFDERPTNREFVIKCAEFISNRDAPASVYDILARP